jgi:monofunctional glycosyltransferase
LAKRVSRPGKKGPLHRALRRGLRVFLKVSLVLLILTVLQVLALRYIDPPLTCRMAFHRIKGALGMQAEQTPVYQWRPLKDISSHLIRAVLAAEDQRFFFHRGFDFVEMSVALQDMAAGERLRGASTISMQAARTVFLWQDRSWARKALEAYYTVLIEIMWGKRRIMEMYLNTAEWGPNIMGSEAAAKKYFQKTAASLSPEEGALLAAILPSPHRWSPLHPSEYVRERQKGILKDMQHMRLP